MTSRRTRSYCPSVARIAALRAAARDVHDVTAFGKRLAQVLGELGLVFHDQNLHAAIIAETPTSSHYEFVIWQFAIRRG
jgi:hypothetical protein